MHYRIERPSNSYDPIGKYCEDNDRDRRLKISVRSLNTLGPSSLSLSVEGSSIVFAFI